MNVTIDHTPATGEWQSFNQKITRSEQEPHIQTAHAHSTGIAENLALKKKQNNN